MSMAFILPACLVTQIIPQLAAAAWVAQTAQRLPLNLADTLAGQAKFFAYFFKRIAATIGEPEAQPQNTRFSRR